MDAGQLRNMAFLMSLGGLSLGCPPDEKNETTGTGSTEGTGTGADTGSTSSTTSSTTSGATDSGTTTTASTTGEPTTSMPSTATLDTDTGEPAPELPICAEFGDKITMCAPRYSRYAAYYVMYCNDMFAEGAGDGPDCTAALEEYFACLNGVDCKSFLDELDTPVTCAGQAATLEAACPSFV